MRFVITTIFLFNLISLLGCKTSNKEQPEVSFSHHQPVEKIQEKDEVRKESSKPLGVVLPPTVMGNVSDSRRQILLNTLDDELSKYFDVSPPTKSGSGVLEVVKDVFQLQIIEEDGDTQLSLRWMSGEKRSVETNLCEGCKTIDLNRRLNILVNDLVGKGIVEEPVVVEKFQQGVMFLRMVYGKWKWFKDEGKNTEGKYIGELKNGVPNGQGTGIHLNGEEYIGEFKDGRPNGQGTYTWTDGQKYVGEFKNGEKNGQGTHTWSDGKKYVGEYKRGNYHGKGIYTYSNGDKFVGQFTNGKQNGQGVYFSISGRKFDGEWKNNKPWNLTIYNKEGKITGRYVKGLNQ